MGSAMRHNRYHRQRPETGLERKLVRELALRQAPARLQILPKVLCLLDGSNNGSVNGLLVARLCLGEGLHLLGLALREELSLS